MKENLDFPFLNNNSQNDEISNIKNDELNPFWNENVKPKKIEIELEDKKRYANDSTQYNFKLRIKCKVFFDRVTFSCRLKTFGIV